jgi:hypothetical protein
MLRWSIFRIFWAFFFNVCKNGNGGKACSNSVRPPACRYSSMRLLSEDEEDVGLLAEDEAASSYQADDSRGRGGGGGGGYRGCCL